MYYTDYKNIHTSMVRNTSQNLQGPLWSPDEWQERYNNGEATLSELETHLVETGFQLGDVRYHTQFQVGKMLDPKIDISVVPSHLRGLTVYRLKLKKNKKCTHILVRDNFDW